MKFLIGKNRKGMVIGVFDGKKKEIVRLTTENRCLREENAALREKLSQAQRIGRQWDNLFTYSGKPQRNNLDGVG